MPDDSDHEIDAADDGSNMLDVGELIWAVPRLLNRTGRQVELARLLATKVPCVGSVVPKRNRPRHRDIAGVDVLDVLAQDPPSVKPDTTGSEGTIEDPSPNDTAPPEADLAVQDYDSLAASQVVPRLATLSEAELVKILAYEKAHRNRQTILHRVSQLLAG